MSNRPDRRRFLLGSAGLAAGAALPLASAAPAAPRPAAGYPSNEELIGLPPSREDVALVETALLALEALEVVAEWVVDQGPETGCQSDAVSLLTNAGFYRRSLEGEFIPTAAFERKQKLLRTPLPAAQRYADVPWTPYAEDQPEKAPALENRAHRLLAAAIFAALHALARIDEAHRECRGCSFCDELWGMDATLRVNLDCVDGSSAPPAWKAQEQHHGVHWRGDDPVGEVMTAAEVERLALQVGREALA